MASVTNRWERHKELVNQVDIQRIMSLIEKLGSMSDSPDNGVTRLAYSPLYLEAKNLLATMMVEAGLEVRVSPIGNTFGRLAPANCQKPVILTGSHTDSVVHGGMFDGIVGVACALEVLRVIYQIKDELTYPIEMVDFVMEESSRFGAGYGFGSYVMTSGTVDEKMLLLQDSEGIALGDAIQGIEKLTYYPRHASAYQEGASWYIQQSRRDAGDIKAFVELHVEQGQELEERGIPVGVVTGAATPTRLLIELIGQQNHSGTTPIHKRKNALCAASEVILAVDDICQQEAENETVGAITKLIVEPNSVNVIPGRCVLTLDLRGTNRESKQRAVKQLRQAIDTICAKRGVVANIQVLVDEVPIQFSQAIVEVVEKSCIALDIPYRRMPSRAGHDACHMTKLVDEVGMIFVPSKEGISHSPLEWTSAEDIHQGAKVLLYTLLQLALD